MIRMFALTGVLALAVVLVGAGADAADDKVPTIKDIMKKAHAKGGLRGAVEKDVKEGNWEAAAKTVKEWELLGSALEKNKPGKGEAESWSTLTTSYSKTLGSLEKAIDKKDAKAASAALKKVGSSCGACHKQHKGK